MWYLLLVAAFNATDDSKGSEKQDHDLEGVQNTCNEEYWW